MCGIVGWTDFTKDLSKKENVLEKMAETLTARGPDAFGSWLSRHTAFAHRRLIVVDPAGGGQPMVRTDKGRLYVLNYNGELYNTAEIRRELSGRGYVFQGYSDTEVLLVSYIEWGTACLEHFNGIFAFAIWDDSRECLFLARDRLGVKPLFYACPEGSLIFASEIKALLAYPQIRPEIDQTGLAEIFILGPGRTPGHGVFRGILEVKPGWAMTFDRMGVRSWQYWSLRSQSHSDNLETTVEKVRELVIDAVERQMISDVPVCTLLSGGLDSSAITAIANRYCLRAGKGKLKSFSVDYTDNEIYFRPNEFQPNADTPWVRKMVDYLDTDHQFVNIDSSLLTDSLIPALIARDLPGMADVDSSLYLFSLEIKKNATVGLSGECADEVFGGYPWFFRESTEPGFPWVRHLKERMNLLSPEISRQLFPEDYITDAYQSAMREVPRLDGETGEEARTRELFYINLTRWMPILLDRKDRMSMAAGLELRVPFCDHRLVEYVWNIPWQMKTMGGREKGILRQALSGLLPVDVLWRRKSPYPKTHHPAYLQTLSKEILRILDDKSSPLRDLVNSRALRQLAESPGTVLNLPWFGQLMNLPQLFGYFIQVDAWFRRYGVKIRI